MSEKWHLILHLQKMQGQMHHNDNVLGKQGKDVLPFQKSTLTNKKVNKTELKLKLNFAYMQINVISAFPQRYIPFSVSSKSKACVAAPCAT